jgi:hypothetical protein
MGMDRLELDIPLVIKDIQIPERPQCRRLDSPRHTGYIQSFLCGCLFGHNHGPKLTHKYFSIALEFDVRRT